MPKYKTEYLERVDLLVAEGKTSEQAKEKLDQHMNEINVAPGRYFYLEVYQNGEVSGAMVATEASPDTEKGSGIRRAKLPASDYVIVEASEEEYLKSAKGDKSVFNLNEYLKENNMKMKEFPMFEKIEVDGNKMVKFYIAVKRK